MKVDPPNPYPGVLYLRDVMNFHTEVCELQSKIVATRSQLNDLLDRSSQLNDLLGRVEESNNNLDEAMRMLLAETNETRRIVSQMFEPGPVAEKDYS